MSVHDIIIHMQLDQDFCTAICISLVNFKNDNSTMKKPETGKMKTICCPAIQDSKNCVFEYEIGPELRPVKLFTIRSSISSEDILKNILKISEKSLTIKKNIYID